MYGTLDISTSGMIAQRTRLNAIASNMANRNAILDAHGNLNPYKARRVHFAPGDPSSSSAEGRQMGVHVAAIDAPRLKLRTSAIDVLGERAERQRRASRRQKGG